MKIVPTLGPTFISMGQWHLLHLVIEDIRKARGVAAHGWHPKPVRYVTVPTPAQAARLLENHEQGPLVLDIETVMHTNEITMCGVGRQPGEVLCMPWREPYRTMMRKALRDPSTKVAHNIGFDFPRLAEDLGISLDDIKGPWFDTLEAHALCYGDLPHNLESVASFWYERHPWKAEYRQHKSMTVEMYNCHDVDATLAAYYGLTERLAELGLTQLFWSTTMPALRVCIDMHETGIKVDQEQLAVVRAEYEERAALAQEFMDDFVRALPSRQILRSQLLRAADLLETQAEPLLVPGTKRRGNKMLTRARKIRERAEDLGQVNANSPVRLKQLLFGEMGLPRRKSTDEDTIVELLSLVKGRTSLVREEHAPFLRSILDMRKARKMIGTYLSYEQDHLHPRFLLWGTGTGRLSCRDPNIQNIPHRDMDAWKIRSCFVPPVPGWVFTEVDYSQLERRIQAVIWQDEALREIYAQGLDTHTMTAARMFGVKPEDVTKEQRNIAKTAVYGQSYGMGAEKYRRNQARFGHYISLAEARQFLAAVSKAHPGVAQGQQNAVAEAEQRWMLRNRFGRIRWFLAPSPYGDAMNFHPQSNAADIMLNAMVAVNESKHAARPFKIVAQIHDSLLVCHPPGVGKDVARFVAQHMEMPFEQLDGTSFPTDAKIGGVTWAFGGE